MSDSDQAPSEHLSPGSPPARSPDGPPPPRSAAFALGAVFLAVCAGVSLAMSVEHFTGLGLPGCGKGSSCAQAAASVWGRVPGIGWPVSHVGSAYFFALLATWPALRRGVPGVFRWLVRLGLLLSVGFVLVMIAGGCLCPYCLAVHAGNFGFWLVLECGTSPVGASRRPVVVMVAAFALASAVLALVEAQVRRVVLETAQNQARESTAAILAAASRATAEPLLPDGQRSTAPASTPTSSAVSGSFTGRYRLGPEAAVVRFVIFMDYQCVDCRLIEAALMRLFEQRKDMSISVKQFPAGKRCNPYSELDHVNACSAAAAAEAAGILHGNDGFWQMHTWLFEHSGRFTDDELRAAVLQFGYDPADFDQVRHGETVAALIRSDIEEGWNLALTSTPGVFINGVEFKGWQASGALVQVLQKIDERKLPARTAEADHPMLAPERLVFDWRSQRPRELPPPPRAWTRGPDGATIKIVVWGDYLQPNTAVADGIIREFLREHGNARYTFRLFPFNPACNPAAQENRYPAACRAAAAALAAGALNGDAGYWKMHDWLLAHQAEFSDDTLRAALPELGFEPSAFFAAMDDPGVNAAIAADAQVAAGAGLKNTPLIYVNGKIVPRWMHGNHVLLRPILDDAARP